MRVSCTGDIVAFCFRIDSGAGRCSGVQLRTVAFAWMLSLTAFLLLAQPAAIVAAPVGVLGDWKEPGGSVIRVAPCNAGICLWLVAISRTAPASTDIHNPDPSQRNRSLCGLKIGSGFSSRDADHAAGGTLYDPKSGKTYRGQMTVIGGTLELRGYVGIPLFGRSEAWTRPSEPVKPCQGARLDQR